MLNPWTFYVYLVNDFLGFCHTVHAWNTSKWSRGKRLLKRVTKVKKRPTSTPMDLGRSTEGVASKQERNYSVQVSKVALSCLPYLSCRPCAAHVPLPASFHPLILSPTCVPAFSTSPKYISVNNLNVENNMNIRVCALQGSYLLPSCRVISVNTITHVCTLMAFCTFVNAMSAECPVKRIDVMKYTTDFEGLSSVASKGLF